MDGNEGSGYKPFTYLSYEFLNAFTELDSRTDDDKLFHSFAPLTQKKFFLRSRLVRGMDNGMNDCWCLVFGCFGSLSVKSVSLFMFQKPRRHLYTSIASPRTRLSSKVVRPSCCSRSG